MPTHQYSQPSAQPVSYVTRCLPEINPLKRVPFTPTRYMPILPMVLVNGAEGIGTGWSTSIPNYNPRDIVANLQRLLDGEPLVAMEPWYKGFRGTIHEVDSKTSGKSYAINGCVAQVRLL